MAGDGDCAVGWRGARCGSSQSRKSLPRLHGAVRIEIRVDPQRVAKLPPRFGAVSRAQGDQPRVVVKPRIARAELQRLADRLPRKLLPARLEGAPGEGVVAVDVLPAGEFALGRRERSFRIDVVIRPEEGDLPVEETRRGLEDASRDLDEFVLALRLRGASQLHEQIAVFSSQKRRGSDGKRRLIQPRGLFETAFGGADARGAPEGARAVRGERER